jgi:hypothetical protein
MADRPDDKQHWLDYEDAQAQRRDTVRILGEATPGEREPARAGGSGPNREPVAAAAAQPRGRGNKGLLLVVLAFALVTVSCVVLAAAAIRGGADGLSRLAGVIPSFGATITLTPTVTIDTSRPSVVERVQAIGKLESVHYELEKVVSAKSAGPLPDFLTSDRILLVAHGTVVAGVDLTSIRPEDITAKGDTVRLRLPPTEILYSKLDNDKTYVYDRQTGFFSKPDKNLESQLRSAAEQQIVLAAQEDGILLKARQNAEQTLRALATGLGYTEITFVEAP